MHSDPGSRTDLERDSLVGSALRLSYFTIVWNGVVGATALVVGLSTGSLALAGFALNALLDSSASVVLVWRFRKKRTDLVAASTSSAVLRHGSSSRCCSWRPTSVSKRFALWSRAHTPSRPYSASESRRSRWLCCLQRVAASSPATPEAALALKRNTLGCASDASMFVKSAVAGSRVGGRGCGRGSA